MAPLGGIGAGIGSGIGFELIGGAGKPATPVDKAGEATKGADFAAVLKDKLTNLNAQQVEAGNETQDMATGRTDDIAQSMLRIEQANVSLQMATQVRNKVIEAYQEVIRMQM